MLKNCKSVMFIQVSQIKEKLLLKRSPNEKFSEVFRVKLMPLASLIEHGEPSSESEPVSCKNNLLLVSEKMSIESFVSNGTDSYSDFSEDEEDDDDS